MSGMKNSSTLRKAAIVLALFVVLFLPVEWAWRQVMISYGRFLAAAVEPAVNALDWTETSYRIGIDKKDFSVTARMTVRDRKRYLGEFEQIGLRPINLVTYNLILWGALFPASALFLPARARYRYLFIAPLVIVAWHACDLMIFTQNTYWVLAKELHRKFPAIVPYRFLSSWLWWWTFELNRRIIDPFLPMLLWMIFCWKSFGQRQTPNSNGRRPRREQKITAAPR